MYVSIRELVLAASSQVLPSVKEAFQVTWNINPLVDYFVLFIFQKAHLLTTCFRNA